MSCKLGIKATIIEQFNIIHYVQILISVAEHGGDIGRWMLEP